MDSVEYVNKAIIYTLSEDEFNASKTKKSTIVKLNGKVEMNMAAKYVMMVIIEQKIFDVLLFKLIVWKLIE